MYSACLFSKWQRGSSERAFSYTLKKILVCGIGNRLKSDDGLGSYVIEKLSELTLPANVTLRDFGNAGIACVLEIGDYDKVIFIDAIKQGKEAGKVYRIIPKKETFKTENFSVFSLHEYDLNKILQTANSINSFPKEVVILGCEPKDLSFGLDLSWEVKIAVDKIIDLILKEIK
jgi:hydrogenase maturation protease